jgi:ADP-ribose pyrophosphatase
MLPKLKLPPTPPADVGAADGFEILASEPAVELGFLRVDRVDVRVPDGSIVERIAVRHPGAVAVLPIDGDEIILIRQYRAPLAAALLEVPAGKLDVAGEPAATTAVRELEEEIGMRPGRLRTVGGFFTTPGFTDEHIELFVAEELEAVPYAPHGPEEEAAEIVRVPIGEIPALLTGGGVSDVKTMVALQWLLLNR